MGFAGISSTFPTVILETVCPNARYILNKKCTHMYENEDADQLRGNSVTDQRLCSRFLNPGIFTVENR